MSNTAKSPRHATRQYNEADAVARYRAHEAAQAKSFQRGEDHRLARALIVDDAKEHLSAADFKAFLVKIECAESTARELLKIAAAGTADDVRRATALRVADHRARRKDKSEWVPLTSISPCGASHTAMVIPEAAADALGLKGSDRKAWIDALKAGAGAPEEARKEVTLLHHNVTAPPLTPAEGVELAASQGVTMTETEVGECLRFAGMSSAEFEDYVAETLRAEVPADSYETSKAVFLEAIANLLRTAGVGPRAEQEDRDWIASVPADTETIAAAKAAADAWQAVYQELRRRVS